MEVREFYQKNFPDAPRYSFWTMVPTPAITPPADHFLMMKFAGYWFAGCNGNFDEMTAWRREIKQIKRRMEVEKRLQNKKLDSKVKIPIRSSLIPVVMEVGRLHEAGHTVGDISRMLGLTYISAYNYRRKYLTLPELHVINNTVNTE